MFFLEYKNSLHRIFVHLIFWISYISFYSALVSVNTNLSFFSIWIRTTYSIPVDLFATYITIYLLLPKFFIVRKYLLFAFLFVLLAFITIILNALITYFVYIPIYLPEKFEEINFFSFDMYLLLVSTYAVVIFAGGIKLAKLWLKEQKDKARLEKEHIQSELALLKSQLNPHFIFNTLNNIDTLISTNPEKASQSIIHLSDIMRYVTYEATSDFVSVDKEINYLKSFIELQKLRFGQDFISLNVENNSPGKLIAPMLFIPLVENAIKHGNKKVSSPGVMIDIRIDSKNIHFSVLNFESASPINKDSFGGIGLKNLQRRLQLIYPENHSFEFSKHQENKYLAQIWIH